MINIPKIPEVAILTDKSPVNKDDISMVFKLIPKKYLKGISQLRIKDKPDPDPHYGCWNWYGGSYLVCWADDPRKIVKNPNCAEIEIYTDCEFEKMRHDKALRHNTLLTQKETVLSCVFHEIRHHIDLYHKKEDYEYYKHEKIAQNYEKKMLVRLRGIK